uniref:Putative RecA n=1 Tax=viral metagenome TaxID=1070528 RepID=A0A6M3JI87_9ZZZZ
MSDFLSKLAKKLSKKYGTLRVAGEVEDSREYISTGNLALDLALEGGIPMGQVVEWSGKSGSGKSLMLQLLLYDFLKKYPDGVCVWLDRESAFSEKRAKELGLDLNRIILIKAADMVTVPQAELLLKSILSDLKEHDVPKFVAVDSISAFADDSDPTKSSMGRKARELHHFFREILPFINEKTSFHFSNQITFRVGVLFGDNTTVTSGESVKYYSSIRIKMDDKRHIVDQKRGNEVIGTWIMCLVIKTRSGPNYRVVYVPFFYDERCIPYLAGYARLLAQRGYITPNNKQEFNKFMQSTFSYKDDKRLSEFNMEEVLKKYPELLFEKYPPYNENGEAAEGDSEEIDFEIGSDSE